MPNTGLSPEKVEEFKQNGAIHLGQVLDPDELKKAQTHFDNLFSRGKEFGTDYRNLAARSLNEEDQQAAAEGEQMLNLAQLWRRDSYFESLLHKSELLDIVESVIGPEIILYHDQAFHKPAGHGGPVNPHQDNGYWGCEPPDLVSIWIALDDTDEENGCLWMLPGSHLDEARTHERTNSILLNVAVDESKMVSFPMPAGHALMHHCETIHKSEPNRSDRQRRAHAIHYMPPGVTVRDPAWFEDGKKVLRSSKQIASD